MSGLVIVVVLLLGNADCVSPRPASPVRADATISAGTAWTSPSRPKPTVRSISPARIIGLYPTLSARLPPTRNIPAG
ncbi:hypothetical protein [Nonomuraea sp. NPDC049784]|uniref:hypothetical protein n=1 Tax=Nonomuraea sp. NPDC049784 TaxID=3154361 RepID=UPI00340EAD07